MSTAAGNGTREVLDASVKTRVTLAVKQALAAIARSRHLRPADIAREAFRDYVARNQRFLPPPNQEKDNPLIGHQ